jgi:hypothetical protein
MREKLLRQMERERSFSQIDVPSHTRSVAYLGEMGIKESK